MKDFKDIRQSKGWEDFLVSLGWKAKRTSSGILIMIRNIYVGSVIKIQRPGIVTKKDLLEIDELCKPEHPIFIKFEPSLNQDEKVLTDGGYTVSSNPLTVTSTLFLDLAKSEEELWNNVSHSGKYSINRAKREGAYTEVFRNPSEEKLWEFYIAHKETASKQGFRTVPFGEVLAKVNSFKDECFLFCVYDSSKTMVGAKLYLGFDNEVLYSMGATTAAGRKQKSGYLLLWNSMKYFKDLGYTLLDLEGLNDSRFPIFTNGWGGFSHFKEKFGGETVSFPFPFVKCPNIFVKLFSKLIPGFF